MSKLGCCSINLIQVQNSWSSKLWWLYINDSVFSDCKPSYFLEFWACFWPVERSKTYNDQLARFCITLLYFCIYYFYKQYGWMIVFVCHLTTHIANIYIYIYI